MSKLTKDRIIETFAALDEWEDRYRYLLDLAKTLPEMEEVEKTQEALVPGCTSRVWMVDRSEKGVFHMAADSDAHLVRGLIAILFILYDGQPIAEIPAIDARAFFERLGLAANLTPNRRNGFYAMVERINALARVKA